MTRIFPYMFVLLIVRTRVVPSQPNQDRVAAVLAKNVDNHLVRLAQLHHTLAFGTTIAEHERRD